MALTGVYKQHYLFPHGEIRCKQQRYFSFEGLSSMRVLLSEDDVTCVELPYHIFFYESTTLFSWWHQSTSSFCTMLSSEATWKGANKPSPSMGLECILSTKWMSLQSSTDRLLNAVHPHWHGSFTKSSNPFEYSRWSELQAIESNWLQKTPCGQLQGIQHYKLLLPNRAMSYANTSYEPARFATIELAISIAMLDG